MVEIVDFRSLKKDIESQTFRHRPPNRRRFSGLLRDVVAYEKRTTGISAVKMQAEAEELNQSQRVGMSIVIGLFLRFCFRLPQSGFH